MTSCRVCAILEETLERVRWEYLRAREELQNVPAQDRSRAESEFGVRLALEMTAEATKTLDEHKRYVHPTANAAIA